MRILKDIEQDKVIILHLEALSQRGKIELSEGTKKWASYDALCHAQYHETCKEIGEMLLDKWDELSERDFIVWMNGVIEVLVRGEIPE